MEKIYRNKNLKLIAILILCSITVTIIHLFLLQENLTKVLLVFDLVILVAETIALYLIWNFKKLGYFIYFGVTIICMLSATIEIINPLHLLFQAIIIIMLAREFRNQMT